MGSVGNKAPEHVFEDIKGTPLIFGTAHIAPDFIDIDGYSNKKTERGLLGDLAKAVAKYDVGEANVLLDMIKFNEIVQIPPVRGASYLLEWEEVPSAIRTSPDNEDENEYKPANWYLHIRFARS